MWSWLGDAAGLRPSPPRRAARAISARVVAVRDEAPGVRTLVLRPGGGWRPHRAGQHVAITVAVAGRLATRTFTISSPPGGRELELTIKDGGRVSGALVRDARPGDVVGLGEPAGDFVLPDQPGRVLFVTAGSGVTPAASMLRDAAARRAMPDAVHVQFARTPRDAIFGDELAALARAHASYRHVAIATARAPRRLSAAYLAELVPDWRDRAAWVCGPAGLIAAATAAFADAGRAHALHVERFHAAVAPAPADARGGTATFRRGAATTATAADGQAPLLVVAERAGLAPRHGCRMGICHSCDAALVSGCARDLRTGARITEPGARVQLCVSAAAGDLSLDLEPRS
jgi:ferredoxin-NADP reductase